MLVGFAGGQVQVEVTITFQLTVDNQQCMKIVEVEFFIVSTQ